MHTGKLGTLAEEGGELSCPGRRPTLLRRGQALSLDHLVEVGRAEGTVNDSDHASPRMREVVNDYRISEE